eukprot:COSAG06_NODE_1936_length_8030_cov_4.318245_9_plen_136_part_00
MPDDGFSRQMLLLLLDLLQSGELPELAEGGAWSCVDVIMCRASAALSSVALEGDICRIATDHLHAVGPAADWMVSLLYMSFKRRVLTKSKRFGWMVCYRTLDGLAIAEYFEWPGWQVRCCALLHQQFRQGFAGVG